jgi:hypothetical protein
MNSRTVGIAIIGTALSVVPRTAIAADSATLLRVFLRDGSSLVSYGEPARVGDRVIFSMPTAPASADDSGVDEPSPPLHLVDIPVTSVDWDRTSQYAESARAAHYIESRAELDYAALTNSLAGALNEVAATNDPSKRLTIVEGARKTLAEWPQKHFNYRQAEVRQMIGMLDEAIADLRVATGTNRIDLSFSATEEPVQSARQPILPMPTLRESIEQALTAARVVDRSVERMSLLQTALIVLERGKESLPSAWLDTTRTDIQNQLRIEQRIDGSYFALSRSIMALADQRVRVADVRGLERLLVRISQSDETLGYKRPEAVQSLVAAVQERLDTARRLRLAYDRWQLRAPMLAEYRLAIDVPMTLFANLRPALESIRSLAGSSPAALAYVQRVTAQILKATSGITPPQELTAAHALLVSATQLAASAGAMRREATLANDIDRAWSASSAAAGALMLGAKARTDIQMLLRPPEVR